MTKLLAITVVFLSFEHSAQATALSLREPLDRDNGNIEQIAGEYHGGTDRKNWGKVNEAYRARVMSGISNPEQNSGVPKNTQSNNSIDKIYAAYIGGKMNPQQKSEYEEDVNNGLM